MTAPCNWFEREGLKAQIRGMMPDEHFLGCADCRAKRDQYVRLESDLAALRSDARPLPGYQAKVWARIAEHQAAAKPWYQRWWWLLLPAPVIAAVALYVALPRAQPAMLALHYEVVQPSEAVRRRGSGEAKPGDVLSLRASTGQARVTELRVYRGGDELVLRCSDTPPCQRGDGALLAMVVLPSRGEYQALLLASDVPLPAPVPSLAQDIALAEKVGAMVERSEPIEVR